MHVANTATSNNHTGHLIIAWAVLVALTLASYWFRDHGFSPEAALVAILVLTFIKVYMVGHSFMELRWAPRLLRGLFAGWCAGTCGTLVLLAFVF